MPSKGSTTQRGYGASHQAQRARWTPKVEAGQVNCRRCGLRIHPGQPWDLGHDDHDRSKYRGPEHRGRECPAGGNRATKGRNTNRPRARPRNIYIVTGPPAAGKTTWVEQHAKPDDITIDYDAIANTLTPPNGKSHHHEPHIKAVTKAARQAAIDTALNQPADVYIIDSNPSATTLIRYRELGAQIITIDPGRDVVLARCRAERPWQMQQAAKDWYRHRWDSEPTANATANTALGWFKPHDT